MRNPEGAGGMIMKISMATDYRGWKCMGFLLPKAILPACKKPGT
jgi:hypothetical protein